MSQQFCVVSLSSVIVLRTPEFLNTALPRNLAIIFYENNKHLYSGMGLRGSPRVIDREPVLS